MVINRDYRALLTRGRWVRDKATFRKEQESGGVLAICIMAATLLLLIVAVFGR